LLRPGRATNRSFDRAQNRPGGVFSEYLGSEEFYLWFSADEELAVIVTRRRSKSLANTTEQVRD
jgi:hypothetical protein